MKITKLSKSQEFDLVAVVVGCCCCCCCCNCNSSAEAFANKPPKEEL